MMRPRPSRQLAMRIGAKLRSRGRSQIQKNAQLARTQKTNVKSRDKSLQERAGKQQPVVRETHFGKKLGLQGFRRIPARPSQRPKTIADQEMIRQDMARLAQSLYGTQVNGQVGPDGEIYFASERRRYSNIGYWHPSGKESGDAQQTSFVLTPPFDEAVVALSTSTGHAPIAQPLNPSSPKGARIINMSVNPFPVADDIHATVLIGGMVSIPPGYSRISVTGKATLRSSIQVGTAYASATPPDPTHAGHFVNAAIEGDGFSPFSMTKLIEWKMGGGPVSLSPAPAEESFCFSWNLGKWHGEILALFGIAGLYHCWGVGSFINAGLWMDLKSIRIAVH